jgi:hypothetical protein
MIRTCYLVLVVSCLWRHWKNALKGVLIHYYPILSWSMNLREYFKMFQMIDPDTILRPCILVRNADRKWNFLSTSRRCLVMVRYWGILYSTTDRGIGYGSLADETNADSSHEQQRPFVLGHSTLWNSTSRRMLIKLGVDYNDGIYLIYRYISLWFTVKPVYKLYTGI